MCMFLSKTSAYRGDFDKTKYMYFLIKDNKWLEKFFEIWEKVKNSIKNEFDSEHEYNEKYRYAKINSYNQKIKLNSHNNEIPRKGSWCILLSVIFIDSAFRTGNNYYP